MPLISVSSLARGILGKEYGMGVNFADRKSSPSLRSMIGMDNLAGGITFDLITEESHKLENDVTTHAVEEGADVTDHIRNKLRTGSITGLISNFSLFASERVSTAAVSLLQGGSLEDVKKDRVQKAYEFLVELWKKRVPIDIVTVMQVYRNVAITEIEISRDGETGDAQSFQISFQEMNIKKLRIARSEITVQVSKDMTQEINQQTTPNTDVGRTTAPTDFRYEGGV